MTTETTETRAAMIARCHTNMAALVARTKTPGYIAAPKATPTMTTPEQKARLDAFLQINAERLTYLYDRWQDEREYEDFDDYAAEMRKIAVAAGFSFLRESRSPFGFRFMFGEGAQYAVFVTAKAIGWKRHV